MSKKSAGNRYRQNYLLLIAALLCLGIGVTLALLIADTEKRANIFKAGEVDLELTETEWDQLDPEDKIISPGSTVKKDPRIKNTGDSDFYAYLEVWIPTAEVRLIQADGEPGPPIETELFTYEINEPDGSNPGWIELSEYHTSVSGYQRYLYGYSEVMKPGGSTCTLFDAVTFVNCIERDVPEGTAMTIQVYAYGIQAEYLGETGANIRERLLSAYEKYLTELE